MDPVFRKGVSKRVLVLVELEGGVRQAAEVHFRFDAVNMLIEIRNHVLHILLDDCVTGQMHIDRNVVAQSDIVKHALCAEICHPLCGRIDPVFVLA